LQIVCNQINIDRELPSPSKSIYRTKMSISSSGSANQITSDAREGKKASAFNGVGQPAGSERQDVSDPLAEAHKL